MSIESSRRVIVSRGKLIALYEKNMNSIIQFMKQCVTFQYFQQLVMSTVTAVSTSVTATQRYVARRIANTLDSHQSEQDKVEALLAWNNMSSLTKDEWKQVARSLNFSSQHLLTGIITPDGAVTTDPVNMSILVTEWGTAKWSDDDEPHNKATIESIYFRYINPLTECIFTPEEIYNAMYEMDKDTAFGVDHIPWDLLKNMPDYAKNFSNLMNSGINANSMDDIRINCTEYHNALW